MREKISRLLASSCLLIFLAGCAPVYKSPAPLSLVTEHTDKIAEYDKVSTNLQFVIDVYQNAGFINDKMIQEIRKERNAAYAYYWRANSLLAEGNIEGYEEYIGKAIAVFKQIGESLKDPTTQSKERPTAWQGSRL